MPHFQVIIQDGSLIDEQAVSEALKKIMTVNDGLDIFHVAENYNVYSEDALDAHEARTEKVFEELEKDIDYLADQVEFERITDLLDVSKNLNKILETLRKQVKTLRAEYPTNII